MSTHKRIKLQLAFICRYGLNLALQLT